MPYVVMDGKENFMVRIYPAIILVNMITIIDSGDSRFHYCRRCLKRFKTTNTPTRKMLPVFPFYTTITFER